MELQQVPVKLQQHLTISENSPLLSLYCEFKLIQIRVIGNKRIYTKMSEYLKVFIMKDFSCFFGWQASNKNL